MLMCSLPYFYLDLHVCVEIYVPTLRSMCLCASCYVGYHARCYFSPFCPLISLILVFWPFRCGLDLDLMV